MSRLFLLRTIAIFVLIGFLFCPPATQAGNLPSLRMAAPAPLSLDPQIATDAGDLSHLRLIYEGLTRLDRNLAVAPGAAVSWSWNSEHTQVTYTLRPNMLYSDGAPLNALRFEYALLRALSPYLDSPASQPLLDIQGAETYRKADVNTLTQAEIANLRAAVEIRALDTSGAECTSYAQTACLNLRIRLTKAVYDFDESMARAVAYPAREDAIRADLQGWWKDPASLTGNGPFLLTALNANGRTDFAPNQSYWRGTPGYTLTFYYVGVPAFALDAYRAGKLDLIVPALEDVPNIQADTELNREMQVYSGACTQALVLNRAVAPFDDPQIRAAFLYAFDRFGFIVNGLGRDGLPTIGWLPPGVLGPRPNSDQWGYDPGKARQMLENSGYRNPYKLPPITVKFRRDQRSAAAWTWMKAQFKAVLDVSINLNPLGPGQSIDGSAMYLVNACTASTDAYRILAPYWRTGEEWAARLGFSDAQVDDLLGRAGADPDLNNRLVRYEQVVERVRADGAVVFANNNRLMFLVKPYVTGLVATPFDSVWMGEIDPLSVRIQPRIYLPILNKK